MLIPHDGWFVSAAEHETNRQHVRKTPVRQVIHRCCSALGETRAIASLVRDHHSALLRLLTTRTRSREDAKEILQEAYTKLLVLDRTETIRAPVAYLWRIAMNLVIDRGRRRALDQRFLHALPDEQRHELSAEAIVESRERLMIVERAIKELPPRCLEAFNLHVYQSMTFAEVGHEMNISDRMAKKHVARALAHLRSHLDVRAPKQVTPLCAAFSSIAE